MVSLSKRRRGGRLATVSFHTVAITLSVLWFFPILVVFSTSIRQGEDVARNGIASLPQSFSLANYAEAWESGGLLQALINSFVITAPAVVLTMALASSAAFSLSRFRIPFRRTILLVMLAGNLLPIQLALVPVSRISQSLGFYDQLVAVIAVQVAFGVGFFAFVMHGFMRSIPREIQDAAEVDGAGPFRLFWQIILPLCRPALAALSALSFTWIFNDLLWSVTLLQTQSKLPITAAVLSLNGQFVTSWAVVAAATVMAALPCIVVFLIFQKHFVSGLTLGSVK